MAAKIKKGDTVIVIAGRDKGRSGEVIEVRRDNDRALVRGVNMVKRHQRQDEKPTRVGFKIIGQGDDRKKVRVAKRSGAEIDG